MPPAYTLSIAADLRRALDAFPLQVRNEMNQRIENTLALPVSPTALVQTTTIEVDGHKATLQLDNANATVRILDVYSPDLGWAKPRTT